MRPLIIVLATLAAAKDLQKLIKQMTLEEKLGLLHGAPETAAWRPQASVNGLNVDPSIPSPKYSVGAVSETLDQVVRERPCILKLDVEGYEPSVLKGAARTPAG